MLGPARWCFFEGFWILSDGYLQTALLDGLKRQMSKARIDRSDSLIFQHKRRPWVTKYKKYILGSHTRPLKFISAPLKAKHFIGQLWQLMTASNVGARTKLQIANCKYLIIHSPQGFPGIIHNTGWGTLPDCLGCSLQVLKEWVMMPPYMSVKMR